jgi:hypothetical protein
VVVGGAGVLIGVLLGGWEGCEGCSPVGGSEGRERGTGGGSGDSCVGCGLFGALKCEDVGGAA